MRHPRPIALLALLLAAGACSRGERPVFKRLSPSRTGVTFANTITTSDSLNIQTDVYVYNGAGVAAGDVDGDGLPDLFFAGNMVSSRLYLNKGNFRFADVTDRAGVRTTRWATGATMADVNGDGRLDIYVSVSGPEWSRGADRANALFVNNGNGTFTEAAAKYGIADTSFTTHSVFLDYDGDGCLDLFLLNNSPKDFTRFEVASHPGGVQGGTPGSLNELYRNTCRGSFENVSERAGLLRAAGYGLGVAVADLNRDGRPDIYVSNDAAPNDVVYVNNGDGTFRNEAGRYLKHGSLAGMGVDVADVNDDGWPDVVQADMLPHDAARRKRVGGFLSYGGSLESQRRGFRDDYSANSLQIANGVTPDGGVVFSDVAHLAGVDATDWSWAPLFADFDNDGRRDIFISNGYPKAVNDLDYRGTMSNIMRGKTAGVKRINNDVLKALPSYEEPNRVFRNDGDLAFADVTRQWGLGEPTVSYGAAYVDLNDDGRLDLVVNNMDAPASIYENVLPKDGPHHFIQVRLESERPELRGLGATLVLTASGKKQYAYGTPYRGYMSTVDERVHFGLGAADRADSLEVVWPDGRSQVLTGLAADRQVVVRQKDATARRQGPPVPAGPRRFEALAGAGGLAYVHAASPAVDFGVQPLLPYMISRQGPALATGDVDGDGLDDVFVGGGAHAPGRLFLQQRGGTFTECDVAAPWAADSLQEDWGALLFDANGDGLKDLYVASGGYTLAPTSRLLQDRLYVNRGGGRFVRDTAALPPMLTSTAAVRAGDFDGDGRPDLFVGGRLTPRSWPTPARSYVLRNDGGRFTDVTAQVAPDLARPGGLVTDAQWVDYDGDGRLDLVVVGEWMSVEFYHNAGGRLVRATASTGLPPMRGWWMSLAAGDFDGDGRTDLVAGNLGLNHAYAPTAGRKVGVYAGDFTGNGSTDVVLTEAEGGKERPLMGLALLGREIYTLGTRFPTAGSFADVTMEQAFGAAALGKALHYQLDTFASVLLHNEGGGRFSARPLAGLAQIAPIRGAAARDVDGDGRLDLVVAGNLFDAEPNTVRADAGNGLWLRGDGRGHLTPVSPAESGFLAPKNVAGLAVVGTPTGNVVIVANTGDTLQAFRIRK